MARLFTIDNIEGNSNLGNPVFSNYGKMQNYQYLVLSPVREDIPDAQAKAQAVQALTKENMQFKIKKNLMDIPGVKVGGPKNDEGVTISTKEKQEQIRKVLVSIIVGCNFVILVGL